MQPHDSRDNRDPERLGQKILQYARDGNQPVSQAYDANRSTMDQIPPYDGSKENRDPAPGVAAREAAREAADVAERIFPARLNLTARASTPEQEEVEVEGRDFNALNADEETCEHVMVPGVACRRPRGHSGMHQASSMMPHTPMIERLKRTIEVDDDPGDCDDSR